MPQRVLCIEGDRTVLSRVKSILESEGFAVDTSESGLDGIARALIAFDRFFGAFGDMVFSFPRCERAAYTSYPVFLSNQLATL